jgi:Arc/MetJ-type ribon-helix-helix transcriptional regulator
MSADRRPVLVSLPPELVDELDDLVEEGQFGSRSEALRYGARKEQTTEEAKGNIEERLYSKCVS